MTLCVTIYSAFGTKRQDLESYNRDVVELWIENAGSHRFGDTAELSGILEAPGSLAIEPELKGVHVPV